MIVVVGGQSRKAGKTTTICEIIAATREAQWVAIKLTPHDHDPGSSSNPDTQRYLEAGAAESALNPPEIPEGRNVIIESNSVLQRLEPDLVIFVRTSDEADWKLSATAVFERADYVVEGHATEAVIEAIRQRLSARRS